jgi:glycogen(starch) synthase
MRVLHPARMNGARRFGAPAAPNTGEPATSSASLLLPTLDRSKEIAEASVRKNLETSARRAPVASTEPFLRILHMGFEDPLMPGAGGGSVRTHEINRRIVADGHSVIVLTTRYPGWADRIQDGVHYVPIGFGQGRSRVTRLLGYIVRLPAEARKRGADADLVVEDFFAPFSTMAAPLWTKRPTVGMVQLLHARDKTREYKLPFHLIERAGVRQHRRLVAVSQGAAYKLTGMNPAAHIEVIGNGIDPAALETRPQPGKDIVYVGRLELPGKGLDLLLAAWSKACKQVDCDLVIAGSGPDEERVRRMMGEAGISGRVRLVGLLSSARLVVVPSRQETFGLVALEALASATPVIAFDIPCLREVVPPGCGWLVTPFDVDSLASEIVFRYGAMTDLGNAGREGRIFASRFDWDLLARHQLEEYRRALPNAAGLATAGETHLRQPKCQTSKSGFPQAKQ